MQFHGKNDQQILINGDHMLILWFQIPLEIHGELHDYSTLQSIRLEAECKQTADDEKCKQTADKFILYYTPSSVSIRISPSIKPSFQVPSIDTPQFSILVNFPVRSSTPF